jgi:hypothetical protein
MLGNLSPLRSDCTLGLVPRAMSSASAFAAGSTASAVGTTTSTSPDLSASSACAGTLA